jgi:molecular chaperone GrpE
MRTPDEDRDAEIEILGFEGESESEAEAGSADAADAAATAAARELAELRDRHLRLRADLDNFRKRVEREREEARRYALAEPMRELLPVLDNLERAASAQGQLEDLRRGVEMINRQLADVLERFGLAEVPALGESFDPQVHEAVAREESPAVTRPTVVAELQRGYWLHDRLLRPAMVRVALPIESAGEAGDGDGGAPARSVASTGDEA